MHYIRLHIKAIFQGVKLLYNKEYSLEFDDDMRGIVYLLSGEISIMGKTVKQAESCFIENQQQIHIKAMEGGQHQHDSYVD